MQQKEVRDVSSSRVFCVNLQVKVAQEEAQVHARKNLEAEEEVRRARQNAVRSEEERMAMERKVQQVESAMHAQLRYATGAPVILALMGWRKVTKVAFFQGCP